MKSFILTASIFLTSTSVFAYGPDAAMHDTAHFGGTYAITHGTEVVCKKLVGSEHKLACTVVGVVAANAINIGRKVKQGLPEDTQRAIIAGALGSATAALVITIDF